MQQCRVLVVNDFAQKGGAEEVYRQSADLLRGIPGVDVECFDASRFDAPTSAMSKAWNLVAARALEKVMVTFKPHRVLVHNYHNTLSAAVLSVIARHKREHGLTAYLTCHDYHLVYYTPTLQYYREGRVDTLPLNALRTWQALRLRASDKGPVHDVLKKAYWHAMRAVSRPEDVFEAILCPSPFMQQALNRSGIVNTVMLSNPSTVSMPLMPPKVRVRERVKLAFVGRIAQEKGLAQFIELAQSVDFAHIERLAVFGDGPDRVAIEQRFSSLVECGKLVFFGRLSQDRLFAELNLNADALVLPSLCAENAPLAIIEAAMLGLPALIHDVGSLSTFGDAVGNKVKFRSDPQSLRSALDQLIAHLSQPGRSYDVSEYSPRHYATRLAQIMQIGEHGAGPDSMIEPDAVPRSDTSRHACC